MNEIMPFDYDGATVRTIVRDGEPWFVLADLCTVLGLTNVTRVAERLDPVTLSQAQTQNERGQMRTTTIVNESGMYEVVIRSDKPEAITFRRWLTSVVLPEIRRTGSFNSQPALPQSMSEALRLAADEYDRAEQEKAARIEAEQHAQALTVPAAAWSHLAESTGDYEVADAAKVLSRDPSISIGRDRLFRFMQAEGWIFRDRSTNRWKPYQPQVDNGRLVEKLGRPYLHEPSGEMRNPAPTIRITTKGLAELHKRLGGGDMLPTLALAQ